MSTLNSENRYHEAYAFRRQRMARTSVTWETISVGLVGRNENGAYAAFMVRSSNVQESAGAKRFRTVRKAWRRAAAKFDNGLCRPNVGIMTQPIMKELDDAGTDIGGIQRQSVIAPTL